jgi:hypothetical protein
MSRTILLVVPCLVAIACVETDGPSVFIGGNAVLEMDCTVDPESPTLNTSGGIINVQFGTSYTAFPWYLNQLFDRSSPASMADPNWVLLTGAEIELRQPGGATIAFGGLPNPFTIDASVAVPSTETPQDPGRAVGALELIPAAYTQAFDALLGDDPNATMSVVAVVNAFGETTGGVDIEVATWTWPITICQGSCLLTCGGGESPRASCQNCADGGCFVACGDGRACDPMMPASCSAGFQCFVDGCALPCTDDASCAAIAGGFCFSGRCIAP